jgi:hypothetical protein
MIDRKKTGLEWRSQLLMIDVCNYRDNDGNNYDEFKMSTVIDYTTNYPSGRSINPEIRPGNWHNSYYYCRVRLPQVSAGTKLDRTIRQKEEGLIFIKCYENFE